MRDIMDKKQLMEYLGLEDEKYDELFPAPPSFIIAGMKKYQLEEIKIWIDEMIESQHKAKGREAKDKYMIAQKHIVDKEYEKGADVLKEVITLDRTQADYHFNYGFCLFHIDKFELAEIEMRKALEQNPKGEWRDAAKYHIEVMS